MSAAVSKFAHLGPTPGQPLTDLQPVEWIHLLYEGMVPPFGAIELRLIDKSGGRTRIEKQWMPQPCTVDHPDAKTLEDVRRWQGKGWNVYYGISIRKQQGISGDDQVHPTHLVWQDLDAKQAPAYLPEGADVEQMTPAALHAIKVQLFEELMRRCEAANLPPVAVVNSGHGLQVLWRRCARSTTKDTEAYNVALRELFKDLGADRATKNPERVFRLPSGVNLKNPERPLPVEIWHLNPLQNVDRHALDALVKPEPVRAAAPLPTVTPSSEPPSKEAWAKKAAKRRHAQVEAAVKAEAAIVADAPSGERNNLLNIAAVKLSRFLPHGELEESELIEALADAARAAGLDEGEIMPTIRSGISKGTQDPADPQRFDDEERQKAARGGVRFVRGRAAAPVDVGELPDAGSIPAPELPIDDKGKMDYSDAQVLALLDMEAWGVVSPHSEQAHAIRLKAIAGNDLLYVPGKDGREWHVWTSRYWRDGAGAVALAKGYASKLSASLAPETARLEALAEVLYQAERQEDAAAMKRSARRHVRAAKAVEENKRQRAVLDLSSVHFLAQQDAHELFALRPWVLGFQNGTLDGNEFREHRREDYMLSLLRVPYSETWQGGEWEELLGRMTGGDTELAQTLQDVAGYALSGSSSQRVVFMAYGPARSGKSTFTALLETVLGDQANTVEPKHLSGEGVRGLLGSRLWNRRLGVCHEAGRVPIDAELLKTMSGGDSFTVKHLYKDEFTAQPTHALVLVANDPPRMDGLDPALRERVVALPFEYDLDPENRRDLFDGRKLEEVRREPHSALVRDFTAWAAQGMRRVFLSRTIFLAPAVALATAKLWEDMGDELAGFWETLNASEISLGVGVRELRGRYVDWCGVNGLKALPARKWDRACEAVGLEKKNTGQAWVWKWSRPGVAWAFDNLTAFTTFPGVPTGKSESEQNAMGDVSQGDFAKEVVKPVKPSDEDKEDAPRKVVF